MRLAARRASRRTRTGPRRRPAPRSGPRRSSRRSPGPCARRAASVARAAREGRDTAPWARRRRWSLLLRCCRRRACRAEGGPRLRWPSAPGRSARARAPRTPRRTVRRACTQRRLAIRRRRPARARRSGIRPRRIRTARSAPRRTRALDGASTTPDCGTRRSAAGSPSGTRPTGCPARHRWRSAGCRRRGRERPVQAAPCSVRAMSSFCTSWPRSTK